VAADGTVVPFGDAAHLGALPALSASGSLVSMAPTTDGGYWLTGADGEVFAEGDAGYAGSMGGRPLNQPIVGIAPASAD